MRKITSIAAAVALLAVPASADAHRGHHRAAGVLVAAKTCRTERQADPAAFKTKYANSRGRHAFRRCVVRHVRQARQTCRSERRADPAAFRSKYANQRGRRAFPRCVRQHAGDAVA